jgi:hypothetical protein
MNEFKLSESQKKAIELIESCKNVFVTGAAGTGKSYLLKYMSEHKELHVTATSNSAALIVGGVTIHSWLGYNPANNFREKDKGQMKIEATEVLENKYGELPEDRDEFKKIRGVEPFYNNLISLLDRKPHVIMQIYDILFSPKSKNIPKKIKDTKILAIDEVSMLTPELFYIIDIVLRISKNEMKKAFGGVQIILFGDFFQLPAIISAQKKEEKDYCLIGGDIIQSSGCIRCLKSNSCPIRHLCQAQFCFETETWKEAKIESIVLETHFRQNNKEFADLLGRLSRGYEYLTSSDIKQLESRNDIPTNKDVIFLYNTKGGGANEMGANKMNDHYFNEIENDIKIYNTSVKNNDKEDTLKTKKILDKYAEDIGNTISLKNNCRVILNATISYKKDEKYEKVLSGSLGQIIGFSNKIPSEILDNDRTISYYTPPKVKFDDGREVEIKKQKMKIKGYSNKEKRIVIIGEIEYMPLFLGYAITVHKSQGMTIDKISYDLNSIRTDGRRLYVALSRVKNINGLYLRNIRLIEKVSGINEKVIEFYDGIAEKEKTLKIYNMGKEIFIDNNLKISIEYFYISKTRLILCYLLSAGLYKNYWMFRNWQSIQKSTKKSMYPFWRALFSSIWVIPLFNEIKENLHQYKTPPPSFYTFTNLFLLIYYIIIVFDVVLVKVLPFPPTFISVCLLPLQLLQPFTMLPIQNTLNNYNKVINKDSKLEKKFTLFEVIILLLGLFNYLNIIYYLVKIND